MISLDTSALIDLQREIRNRNPGPVRAVIAGHANEPVFVSVVAAIEFGEGYLPDGRLVYERFLAPFTLLPLENSMRWQADQIRRTLREAGTPIGDNDLLIGITALHHGLEIVTKNPAHFQRIPGLRVVSY